MCFVFVIRPGSSVSYRGVPTNQPELFVKLLQTVIWHIFGQQLFFCACACAMRGPPAPPLAWTTTSCTRTRSLNNAATTSRAFKKNGFSSLAGWKKKRPYLGLALFFEISPPPSEKAISESPGATSMTLAYVNCTAKKGFSVGLLIFGNFVPSNHPFSPLTLMLVKRRLVLAQKAQTKGLNSVEKRQMSSLCAKDAAGQANLHCRPGQVGLPAPPVPPGPGRTRLDPVAYGRNMGSVVVDQRKEELEELSLN